MTQKQKKKARGTSSPSRPAILTFLVLTVLVVLAVHQAQPPAPVPASAPATAFSSARALEHLKVIAQRPHPTGSPENDRVRLYIVRQLISLGLQPVVQVTTGVYSGSRWGPPYPAATVQNIVARLKGTGGAKAVMLAAHYDSVSTGPGASDDGSGVVTLLETARALKAGPKLRNDVILLITDGEELGLLGAEAFVRDHAWAKNVGVVLNFEARGACGPSLMFETSAGNGWLVREFARADLPRPVTSSFMYDIYKRLPNDTDLTVFKGGGLAGLNFAYVGCWPRYHSAADSVENIDQRSLQHDGSYALGLARHFGNLNLAQARLGDAAYFNLFSWTVHYPETAVIPLTAATVLLFIGVAAMGFRKRQLTGRGIAAGFFGWLGGTAVGVGLSHLLWIILRGTRFAPQLPYGMAYNSELYAVAFMALTAAVLCALYAKLLTTVRVADLAAGALIVWALLAMFSSLYVPGANYLFAWPLLVSLGELGYAFAGANPEAETESALVWTLPAIVGILLFVPLPYLLTQLSSAKGPALVTAPVALLVGFLVPQIHIITARNRWVLAGLTAVTALVLMVIAMTRGGYDANHPRADSIFYTLNADTGRAAWVSADPAPDEWTSQFLRARIQKGRISDFAPGSPWIRGTLEAEAPALPLAAAEITTLDDLTFGDVRTLRLSITSPRGARVAWVEVQNAGVLGAEINGRKITGSGAVRDAKWGLLYTALPQKGILLTLNFKDSQQPVIRVVDFSDGLPQVPGASFRPRPPDLMPSPAVQFDSCTLVSGTFKNFQMQMPH